MEFKDRCEQIVARLREVRPADFAEGVRVTVTRGPTGSALIGLVVAADLEPLDDAAVAFAMAFARSQDIFTLLVRSAGESVPDGLEASLDRLPEAVQGPATSVVGFLGAGVGAGKVSTRLLLHMGDFQREAMCTALQTCVDAGYPAEGALRYFEHLAALSAQRPKPTLGRLGRAFVAGSEIFDKGIKPFRSGEPVLASPQEQLEFARALILELGGTQPSDV